MKIIYFICPLLMMLLSCRNEPNGSGIVISPDMVKEPMINVNKARVKAEAKVIDEFIIRRKWEMNATGTGLRYFIYQQGRQVETLHATSLLASDGKTAVINYEVSLLNGTVCYSSKKLGTKGFTVGKGEIEKGIDEGVLLMHIGDKAKFILPSHLAYGLMGDGKKIPSNSILLYEVELIDIK